ncbi:hypothetical protein H8959_014538, partial [Pygathrix nigripes]
MPSILEDLESREAMRFRFCDDLDCRDWVLAEISTLAKMGNWEVAGATVTPSVPLTGPSESDNVKATVAVLSYVLSSAAKHSVDGGCLSSELQQLGLPKEHAASLCHSYEEKQSPLQKHLGSATYAVSMRPASVRAHSRRVWSLAARVGEGTAETVNPSAAPKTSVWSSCVCLGRFLATISPSVNATDACGMEGGRL